MTNLILHLGGSGKAAVAKCEQLYYELDGNAQILVSSENPEHVESYSPDIPVYHHREAWDTVTNFTTTYDFIQQAYNPKKIYIVCNGFHMKRAILIAKAVYWQSKVKLIRCPSTDTKPRKQDKNITIQDTWRAWCWKFSGILFYWKSLRDVRQPESKNASIPWNEIPIERLSFLPAEVKKKLCI